MATCDTPCVQPTTFGWRPHARAMARALDSDTRHSVGVTSGALHGLRHARVLVAAPTLRRRTKSTAPGTTRRWRRVRAGTYTNRPCRPPRHTPKRHHEHRWTREPHAHTILSLHYTHVVGFAPLGTLHEHLQDTMWSTVPNPPIRCILHHSLPHTGWCYMMLSAPMSRHTHYHQRRALDWCKCVGDAVNRPHMTTCSLSTRTMPTNRHAQAGKGYHTEHLATQCHNRTQTQLCCMYHEARKVPALGPVEGFTWAGGKRRGRHGSGNEAWVGNRVKEG